jgi:hypothetical protein
MGRVRDEHLASIFTSTPEGRPDDEHAGELAVGTGRWPQTGVVHAAEVLQGCLEVQEPREDGLQGGASAGWMSAMREAISSPILGLYFMVHDPRGYMPWSMPVFRRESRV